MPVRLPFLFTCTALAVALGCGPPAHGPFFGDERLLVFGVSPDSEADALSAQLKARGLQESLRIRGKDFTALGYAPAEGSDAQPRVRVITGRGIELALDSREAIPLEPGVRYRLLPSPLPDTHDGDGDGFDEVYISRTALPSHESCIQVYRVRDSGFVDPIEGDGYGLAGVPAVSDPGWQQPFCSGMPDKPQGQTPETAIETPAAAETQQPTETNANTPQPAPARPDTTPQAGAQPAPAQPSTTPQQPGAAQPAPAQPGTTPKQPGEAQPPPAQPSTTPQPGPQSPPAERTRTPANSAPAASTPQAAPNKQDAGSPAHD